MLLTNIVNVEKAVFFIKILKRKAIYVIVIVRAKLVSRPIVVSLLIT